MLYNGIQVDESVHKWPLTLSMLNIIFHLHTKM